MLTRRNFLKGIGLLGLVPFVPVDLIPKDYTKTKLLENKAKPIKWREYKLAPVTEPLAEGVIPTGQRLVVTWKYK